MAMTKIEGGVCAPKGFLATGIYCGIRKNPNKKDLALIYSEQPAVAAAVYTQNKTKAAPLAVTHKHMEGKKARAIICNSGNANACTADGFETATNMCQLVADKLNIPIEEVLVASTGVIGQPLDISPIANSVNELVESLNDSGSEDCANAIMTTDLTKKEIAYEISFPDGSVGKIGGVAKGSGMIHPNMATMLGFVTTDINISQELMQKALSEITNETFNMISVDGDTSTNDMLLLLANGEASNNPINNQDEFYNEFYSGLLAVCKYLAVAIAADGEGASKLLECTVTGAKSIDNARVLSKSVITSSLFKAAMFGSDANWGRVLCALGNAPTEFDPLKACVSFESNKGTLEVCKNGFAVAFDEEKAKMVLDEDKIIINISLQSGEYSATAWGCDLTYDYVEINGDYRS